MCFNTFKEISTFESWRLAGTTASIVATSTRWKGAGVGGQPTLERHAEHSKTRNETN